MDVRMVAPNGFIVTRPTGFSWTTIFFGCLPALFRTDWKYALILFIIQICTYGLGNMIFAFFYNKLHLKDLMEKGYKPADDYSHNRLVEIGLLPLNEFIEH